MQVGSMAHVINGRSGNQIRSPILRSPIGIDNHRALSWETLHNAGSDRLDYRPHSSGVVVSGQAHQDVYLAYVDQLAKKIIRENTFLGQLELRTQVVKAVFVMRQVASVAALFRYSSDSSQSEPVELVRAHG